jgi:hypothetical protein
MSAYSGVFAEFCSARTFVLLHHIGPSGREAFVGHPSQQEGVARGELGELVLLLLLATELEGPTRILYNPIHRHELRYDQFSHSSPPVNSLRVGRRKVDARIERLRIHELQGFPDSPIFEEALASAQYRGMDHYPELVEQSVLKQRPGENTAI